MNDDEIVERLRRALHTEAEILTPGYGTPRVTPVSARPHRRLGVRNGGYVLLAAVAVIAAIVVIAINLGRPHTRVDLAVGGPTDVVKPDYEHPSTRSLADPAPDDLGAGARAGRDDDGTIDHYGYHAPYHGPHGNGGHAGRG